MYEREEGLRFCEACGVVRFSWPPRVGMAMCSCQECIEVAACACGPSDSDWGWQEYLHGAVYER